MIEDAPIGNPPLSKSAYPFLSLNIMLPAEREKGRTDEQLHEWAWRTKLQLMDAKNEGKKKKKETEKSAMLRPIKPSHVSELIKPDLPICQVPDGASSVRWRPDNPFLCLCVCVCVSACVRARARTDTGLSCLILVT